MQSNVAEISSSVLNRNLECCKNKERSTFLGMDPCCAKEREGGRECVC